MDIKKDWKDFQALVDIRPDHRAWLHCEDPEEKELRKELLELTNQLSQYASLVQRIPMPEQIDDIFLSRSSAHINQRVTFELFIEILFENCLKHEDSENLNLLFAFLETYTGLLKQEYKWCENAGRG